jgi:hypothetical protein
MRAVMITTTDAVSPKRPVALTAPDHEGNRPTGKATEAYCDRS